MKKETKILNYNFNKRGFDKEDLNPSSDKLVLYPPIGNITPIVCYAYNVERQDKEKHLFIPYDFRNTEFLNDIRDRLKQKNIILYTFDCDVSIENNILPKWNIPEDSAVVFRSVKDYNRYIEYIDFSKHAPELNDITCCKKVSIILPQLHAEDKSCPYHIENINKICQKLKEKYGFARIELFVSHCLICFSIWQNFTPQDQISYNSILIDKPIDINDHINDKYEIFIEFIDKITKTNSTGAFKKKSDRLEVVDVIEYFND